MGRFFQIVGQLATEVFNGIAFVGLVYVIAQDVTVADIVRWFS